MSSITPYKFAIPEARIQRRQQKLALADFPDEIRTVDPTAESHPELYEKFKATLLSADEIEALGRTGVFSTEANGYYQQQSTRPHAIGYSLTDSPVGLLAWLYEKLHDWTDNHPWTDEEVLTWVSIHYFSTAAPAAPSCICYTNEHREPGAFAAVQPYVDVPLGIARFAKDLLLLPKL